MSHIAYKRVSTLQQNTDRQLADCGIKFDKIFEDKMSGKNKNRPQLNKCLTFIREGDTLHVHSLDRLARNLVDLQKLVEQINNLGVIVIFHKEGITCDNGKSTATGTLMLQLLGAFAQFERSLIKERQQEGIKAAHRRGVLFGAPRKQSEETRAAIKKAVNNGESIADVAKQYGTSRGTVYNILK